MQTVKIPADRILGIPFGPDRWQLRLNKRELETIKRANDIREKVRDQLRELMGWQVYEDSHFYVLHLGNIIDSDGVFAFDWDYSGERI